MSPRPGSIALSAIAATALLLSCGSRRPLVRAPTLRPLPPAPPGSVVVFGPLKIESIDVVRTEIGWDRELASATRTVAYDVTLNQVRSICPSDERGPTQRDAEGCDGAPTPGPKCKAEPPLRARTEVVVRYAIEVSQRCTGDPLAYAVPPSGDARTALTAAGVACFKNKNKYKPEPAWTSIYALTELALDEKLLRVDAAFPAMIAALSSEGAPRFCRDDGAYLDGSIGRSSTTPAVAAEAKLLAPILTSRAPIAGELPSPGSPVTYQTEHALWESCNASESRDALVAQERCQLIRQLDKLLRDVEDIARPETPRGSPPAGSSSGAP